MMNDLKSKFKKIFNSMDPIFWILVGILLFERLFNGNINLLDTIYEKITMIPGIILGVTLHEAGHAYASHFLGDPTPKSQGRLSINPIRHMDPFGFLFLIIAGFGWGRPVEVSPYYYKNKRRDEFIVSIAGVTVNFLLAVIFAFLTRQFVYKAGLMSDDDLIMNFIYHTINLKVLAIIYNLYISQNTQLSL